MIRHNFFFRKKPNKNLSLSHYLEVIHETTEKLKIVGIILLAITLCNIGILLAIGAQILIVRSYDHQFFSFILLIFCLTSIALALFYDLMRREGNILYEEISNELHGKDDDESHSKHEYEKYKKSRLQAKVMLRRFTHNSELPLIPGRYGPAILAAVNLLAFVSYLAITLPRL